MPSPRGSARALTVAALATARTPGRCRAAAAAPRSLQWSGGDLEDVLATGVTRFSRASRSSFHRSERSTDSSRGQLPADQAHTLQSWFKALEIDANQAWKLCNILDAEKSGRISLEDFVDWCLRLRGPAARVDAEALMWDVRCVCARAEHAARILVPG
ncbi:unnamed protein product [Prorocentrum cordatum]|uniref:EF-hand domain-containing protein n=1 Tax=Prorocentrum cordatum TaxID=2364126 RepID=A0ABN9Y4D4_9DINO|nr:unnamed protein product [Polarella glacialis]